MEYHGWIVGSSRHLGQISSTMNHVIGLWGSALCARRLLFSWPCLVCSARAFPSTQECSFPMRDNQDREIRLVLIKMPYYLYLGELPGTTQLCFEAKNSCGGIFWQDCDTGVKFLTQRHTPPIVVVPILISDTCSYFHLNLHIRTVTWLMLHLALPLGLFP